MAIYYDFITDEQAALIDNAPLFSVASVDPELTKGPGDVGPVNLSPEGWRETAYHQSQARGLSGLSGQRR